jgi:hypothetical protein
MITNLNSISARTEFMEKMEFKYFVYFYDVVIEKGFPIDHDLSKMVRDAIYGKSKRAGLLNNNEIKRINAKYELCVLNFLEFLREYSISKFLDL